MCPKPILDHPGDKSIQYPKAQRAKKVPIAKSGSVPDKNAKWSFSFAYYNQKKYFGLDRVDSGWFVSLLERLSDLSKTDRESVTSNRATKDGYRYHSIDWTAKNIPISRQDLNWIPKEYLDNETEFPILQFHISKANGRVAGFWSDNSSVFNIVLLDPLHNLQPAGGKFGYSINDCDIKSSEYRSVLAGIDKLKGCCCGNNNCPMRSEIINNPKLGYSDNLISIYLDNDYKDQLEKYVQHGIANIIKHGLVYFTPLKNG